MGSWAAGEFLDGQSMPRGKSKPVAPTEVEETMTTGVRRRGACGGAHQLYWVEVGDLKG